MKAIQIDLFVTVAGTPPAQATVTMPDRVPAGMVRAKGHETSRDAATGVAGVLTKLHALVLEEFERRGPMTDETLERLPVFADFGPSTIRNRRSELYQRGLLVEDGTEVNSRRKTMVRWKKL